MANIKNLAADFVVTPPSPAISGTTLTVRSGAGQTFPPTPFYATATPPSQLSTQGTSEIVLVTARSTDTMTITRAQKGTTAQSIGANWVFVNGIYAEDINNSTIVLDELMTPAANGTNKVFTTASPFTAILPYKNGVTMHQGASYDFTVTGTNQITYNTAPPNGANLTATYIIGNQVNLNGSNSFITKEAIVGTPNGSTTTFATQRPYIGGTLQVFINGLNEGNKVVETNPSTGSFTLDVAYPANTDIQVSYQYAVTATFNADTVDGIHASTTAIPGQLYPLSAKFVDANGWTVYDYGIHKRYIKQVSMASISVAANDRTQTAGITLPLGMASLVGTVCSTTIVGTQFPGVFFFALQDLGGSNSVLGWVGNNYPGGTLSTNPYTLMMEITTI